MADRLSNATVRSRDSSLLADKGHARLEITEEPVLSLYGRMIETAVAEATKGVRFGLPTADAMLAREWIETVTDPGGPGRKKPFTGNFEQCCLLLGMDPEWERARLLEVIEAAWVKGCLDYWRASVEMRRAAVRTFAGCSEEMSGKYARLLVSEDEYDDAAGLNRDDPPGWEQRVRRPNRMDVRASTKLNGVQKKKGTPSTLPVCG